jgi:hypothetical protein
LAKLTRNFFISRIYKKLGKNFNLINNLSVTEFELNVLWGKYCKIFPKKLNENINDYHNKILQQEKNIPNTAGQLFNLIKYLNK